MARPRKRRCCRRFKADRVYKPQGLPMREIGTTLVSLDQFEAMRLCDSEGLDQEQAGQQMGVSRGTVQRMLYEARRRLVRAIMKNEAIIVNLRGSEVGDVSLYSHQRRGRARRHRQ